MTFPLKVFLVALLAVVQSSSVAASVKVSTSSNPSRPSKDAFSETNVNKVTSQTTKDESSSSTAAKEEHKALSLQVIPLTSKNFGANVGDGNIWLIEFYTPWCKHCQNFASSYNNVAATFHSTPQEGIRIGKVDCQTEKALKTRFGVTSFPSFYLVDGWSVYEFDSPRSEAALMDFARGGYKKHEPIPLYSSPMGPMGLLQGILISLGARAMDFFQYLQDSYGVSPILAGVVLSFCAVVGGMFSVVALAILTTPKTKDD